MRFVYLTVLYLQEYIARPYASMKTFTVLLTEAVGAAAAGGCHLIMCEQAIEVWRWAGFPEVAAGRKEQCRRRWLA
jgi:hypothetical protein